MFMHKWHSYWSDFHISNLLTFNLCKMFKCAYLKFQCGGSTSIHTRTECSSTNIGLAQAHIWRLVWGLLLFPPQLTHAPWHNQSLQIVWSFLIINPRRACAARVTVLGLCVCLLLNISLFTCLFVPQTILTFSAADEGRNF